MVKKIKNNNFGFSLIEVMIALAIFAAFATAMIQTQISNIDKSIRMRDDVEVFRLAELKMNEALTDVKKFTNATENDPDTGIFEIEGFKNYKYKVEYKKNVFPDFAQLSGKDEDEEDLQDNGSAIKKAIFEKLKKNMEKLIWQIKVTVTNADSGYSTELTSWVTNEEAKLDVNFSF